MSFRPFSLDHSAIRGFGSRLVVATTGAILFFSRTFSVASSEYNRFFLHWSRIDSVALLALVALTGLLAAILDAVLRKRKNRAPLRALHFAYLFAVLSGPVAFITVADGWGIPTARFGIAATVWAIVAAAVGVAWYCRSTWLLRFSKSIALLFSPIIIILTVQALTWSTFASPSEPMRFPRPPIRGSTPIFLFLFDELSYDRMTDGGEIIESLPKFREFASSATSFSHASSEGLRTWLSVPRLLFQTLSRPIVRHGRLNLTSGGALNPTDGLPSLFSGPKANGYNTALSGFYFPYRPILGSQLDWCSTRAYLAGSDGTLLGGMRGAIMRQLGYLPSPVGSALARASESEQIAYWRRMDRNIFGEVSALIADCPPNTFSFVHWNVPHAPYLQSPERGQSGPEAEYLASMKYADRRFGEVVSLLKAAGKYDGALIIVTSDHSWRTDRSPRITHKPGWVYHVPLIVKWPGQRSARRVEFPISLIQLQPIIDGAIAHRTIDSAIETVKALPEPMPEIVETDGDEPAGGD